MFTAIFQQTPDWVWGVLATLSAMGFRQTSQRRRSLRSAAALPVVMANLSLYGLASAFSRQPLAPPAWATGVAVILTLCHSARVWGEVRWLEAERSVLMPGSWLPLLLMLGLFCVKFGVSVELATKPGLVADAGIAGFAGLSYGAFSGAFLARALTVWRAVRQASCDPRFPGQYADTAGSTRARVRALVWLHLFFPCTRPAGRNASAGTSRLARSTMSSNPSNPSG